MLKQVTEGDVELCGGRVMALMARLLPPQNAAARAQSTVLYPPTPPWPPVRLHPNGL